MGPRALCVLLTVGLASFASVEGFVATPSVALPQGGIAARRCSGSNSVERSSSSSSSRSLGCAGQRRSRTAFPPKGTSALHMSLEEDFEEKSQVAPGGINVSGEAPFEIRGFSLGTAFLGVGLLLTCVSFFEYFTNSGAGLSGLGFVYGIPVSLIGLSLKYAELEPVPVQTFPDAEELFEVKATETMRKIKQDVTRHRYGDEAHLDTTVKSLGLVMPQSDYPQLQYLKQEIADNGELIFTMVFQSLETPYKRWVEPERIQKYNSFFGPGVEASVVKVDSVKKMVGIQLETVDPNKPKKVEEPAKVVAEDAPAPEAEAVSA